MASQSFAEFYNRSATRQRVAAEDADDCREPSWYDPLKPRPEGEERPESVAEQLGKQAAARQEPQELYPGRPVSTSATAIAAAITPCQRPEPEPAPDEPTSKGVPELIEAYEGADLLYDQRELYGGSRDMSPYEWRTAWGRR